MAVTTTLITNSAMNAYTTVSLTALPTAFAPPPVIVRPAVAGHQAGDQPEQRRLHTRDDHLGHPGQQRDARGERARVDVLDEDREHVAAQDADDDDEAVQQQRHQPRRQHPRGHQPLHRVDAQHLHRVDLFADRARPQIGAHRRRAGAGHDQHRHQRTDLGHRAERRTRAAQVGGAEFAQQDVQREAHQHGERNRHQQRRRQRHPCHEPATAPGTPATETAAGR